jgi:hypothetical protein
MEPEGSLSCSQDPAIGHYLEPHEYRLRPVVIFPNLTLNITVHFTPTGVFDSNFTHIFLLPHAMN